jgi:DNA polymerase
MEMNRKMEEINKRILNCKQCRLWETRSHPVAGEGDIKADLMFIGEAPGYNEDKQGRPFVGRAGKILDEVLATVDLNRESVFIANILKCRPPNNRNPKQDEIVTCTHFLDDQIAIIEPKILVPMGNFACQYIFERYSLPKCSISQVHGKVFKKNTLLGMITIIPLYHPAVATYNPTKIDILKEDITIVKSSLEELSAITKHI